MRLLRATAPTLGQIPKISKMAIGLAGRTLMILISRGCEGLHLQPWAISSGSVHSLRVVYFFCEETSCCC